MKSCYAVAFVGNPGGAARHDIHVVATAEELRTVVADELRGGLDFFMLYGWTMDVAAYEAGRLVFARDLLPHVRIHHESLRPLEIDNGGLRSPLSASELMVLAPEASRTHAAKLGLVLSDELNADSVEEVFWGVLEERRPAELGLRFEVDWGAVGLPVLHGELLQPGESVELLDPFLFGEENGNEDEEREELEYGLNHLM